MEACRGPLSRKQTHMTSARKRQMHCAAAVLATTSRVKLKRLQLARKNGFGAFQLRLSTVTSRLLAGWFGGWALRPLGKKERGGNRGTAGAAWIAAGNLEVATERQSWNWNLWKRQWGKLQCSCRDNCGNYNVGNGKRTWQWNRRNRTIMESQFRVKHWWRNTGIGQCKKQMWWIKFWFKTISEFQNSGSNNLGTNNTGTENVGWSNTGNWNIGPSNTGNGNVGSSNTGNFSIGLNLGSNHLVIWNYGNG